MTQGLARVEELFEARNPKLIAEIADIDGVIFVEQKDGGITLTLTAHDLEEEEYYFGEDFELAVKEGQEVKAKTILARNKKEKTRLVANFAGVVKKVSNGCIVIKDTEKRTYEYKLDLGRTILVKDGDEVKQTQKLTEGNLSLQKLMQVG